MVPVEDVAPHLQVQAVLGDAIPGQGRHHVEVRARHVIFGRLGRHLPQPLQLAVRDLLGLGGEAGLLEAAPQLVQLVVLLVLAQLLPDDAQLLAQYVLALARVEARLDLLLDLAPDLEHLQLLAQQLGEPLEPDVHVAHREQLGLGREGEVQVRRDEVGELAGVADPGEHFVQLLAQVRRDVDDPGELRVHGALQCFRAGVLHHGLGQRFVPGHEPALGCHDLGQAGALEPLHHHAGGPVAQLEHADEDAERPHLIQLVGARLHHRALDGLRTTLRPHHAEQQALVPLHHFVDQVHGVRVVESEGEHDVRVNDQLTQRQDRQLIGGRDGRRRPGHSTFTDCEPEARRGGSLASRTSRKPAS